MQNPGSMSKSAKPSGSINRFIGLLAGRTKKIATIKEINEAAAQGWAGKTRVVTSVTKVQQRESD